jgi:hypothetical protein
MLRLTPSAVTITSGRQRIPATNLSAVRSTQALDPGQATVSGVWASRSDPDISYLMRTTVWKDGAAVRILQQSPRNDIATVLYPPEGMTWTVSDITPREMTVCVPLTGGREPCVRIWAGRSDVTMRRTADGGIRLATSGGHRIELLVTALTAGEPSVGLGLLDPAALIAERNVRAALLWTADPAYVGRVRRLAALGFHAATRFGPYQVMLR